MPLLKFKCEDCGQVFEELTAAGRKVPCPACKSENTVRHYQGKCSFGSPGSGKGGGGCSSGSCCGCSGCASH